MHEGIGLAFLTDFGGRAVAGKDRDVIAEREQFFFNSLEQLRRVTAGQVPAPYASGEKNIAPD